MVIPASMICRCLRCGHEWIKRINGRPKCCARCKETNWDVSAWSLGEVGHLPTREIGRGARNQRTPN